MNLFTRILSRFAFLRATKYYLFFQEIIYGSLVKVFSSFFSNKVDKNLIILSAYGGKAFTDNTKYIYKYLVDKTNFKAIWLTNSHELLNKLKAKGYNAQYKFNLSTIRLLRRAKYVFTTHGVFDVLPINFSPETTFICTWHGVQNKRNSSLHGPNKYTKLAKYLNLTSYNDNYMDFFITPSGTKKDIKLIENYFQIPPTKIITAGYPRNDILFIEDSDFIDKLKARYKIPNYIEKILLYAPTFRDYSFKAKLPFTKEELIEFNDQLRVNHSILIMKAHMFEKIIEFQNFSNIKKAPKNTDIQELLAITDILITDYSSVYCDFLLVNKPILLFTYDYERFMEEGRGFYYNFKKIAPGPLLYTGKELINAIKNIDQIDKEYEDRRLKTRKIYNKYVDGNSTERVLKYLKII